jgi:hypothetical protein
LPYGKVGAFFVRIEFDRKSSCPDENSAFLCVVYLPHVFPEEITSPDCDLTSRIYASCPSWVKPPRFKNDPRRIRNSCSFITCRSSSSYEAFLLAPQCGNQRRICSPASALVKDAVLRISQIPVALGRKGLNIGRQKQFLSTGIVSSWRKTHEIQGKQTGGEGGSSGKKTRHGPSRFFLTSGFS